MRLVPSLLFLVILSTYPATWGAYWDTLPKGVRAVVYRNVSISGVDSEFSPRGQVAPYFFNMELNAKNLSDSDPFLAEAFNYLNTISPEAYNAFTAGSYEASGSAKTDVNGFGLGWGITNKLSAYTSVPIFKANTNLTFNRTTGNNYSEVQKKIEEANSKHELAPFYHQLLGQINDADGPRIQSILVNKYGYKPIGNWQAQGLGDIELGLMYRLANWGGSGLLLTGGVVLPTGRVDNPDILQDFGFGDGQTDYFLEFGGGSQLLKGWISLDSWSRVTYQAASKKRFRIPEDSDFMLGSESGTFKEKLGNKFDFSTNATIHATDWLDIYTGYLYNYIGPSKYESEHSFANAILGANTEQETHFLRGGFGLSTVNFYKRGSFFLPMNSSLSVQKAIGGMNSPRYTRYDLEFRFFF